ncbi:MAG: hypothetical protein U5K76_03460 [Woeseiaceae bacterium]|nr:hypothetical protein [Woeseiaceae bacterium]
MKKLGIAGRRKTHERVITADDQEVVMTSTQAYRYKELQSLGYARDEAGDVVLEDKPVYTLEEAAARLEVSPGQLLSAAANGRIRCYVDSSSLRGRWGESSGNAPKPDFLAITRETCGEIWDFGSANVGALEHHLPNGQRAVFTLDEKQFVDSDRLLMLHPLPRIRTRPVSSA